MTLGLPGALHGAPRQDLPLSQQLFRMPFQWVSTYELSKILGTVYTLQPMGLQQAEQELGYTGTAG